MQTRREQLEEQLRQSIAEKIRELQDEAGMELSSINIQIVPIVGADGKRRHYLFGIELNDFSQPV